MNTNKKNFISRFGLPILIIVFIVAAYFIYEGFFKKEDIGLTETVNKYLNETKIGKDYQIATKESLSFDTNINNNILTNGIDFSENINPGQSVGRANPFLP